MTQKERAAMQQALEALKYGTRSHEAIIALDEALAEPDIETMTLTQIAAKNEQAEQEPVGWLYPEGLEALRAGKPWTIYATDDGISRIPVYLNDAVARRVEPPVTESGAGFESLSASPKTEQRSDSEQMEQVAEWEKLKDPQTLFVNLNRGFPAQLTHDHLLHLLNKTEQAEQEPIILKFPRQKKNCWTIDWKTISSVEDAIEDNEFKPCPEGVEQVLLALEKVYPATQPVQAPVAWARTSESGEVLDCISHTYKVTQPCTVDYDEPLYAAQKTTVWKAIDGYEEQYEVSDEGDIRNKKTGKVLAKSLMGDGYVKADLWKNGERWQTSVHRIVAAAFIDNPENLPEVNHINGIKTDNRTSNLEWTTRADNVNHSYYELGNQVNPIVATNIVTDERVEYPSVEAAVRAGFNSGSIYRCLSGKYTSTNGWRFEKQPAPVRTKDLSDDEIEEIFAEYGTIPHTKAVRAIIEKFKEKNQ